MSATTDNMLMPLPTTVVAWSASDGMAVRPASSIKSMTGWHPLPALWS